MRTETTTRRVAANLRAELARQGMTQDDLAAALGVSQQAISRRLLGRGSLTVDDLEALARVLDTTPERLLAPMGALASAGDAA